MERFPKLHLGSGRHYWPGFVNVDLSGADVSMDVEKLEGFRASEIHAIHLIEHLSRITVVDVLKRWHACLIPGGLLVLECPDLDRVLLMDRGDMLRGLYGDHQYKMEPMMHRWCYTGDELKSLCEEAGFEDVRIVAPVFHKPRRDMRIEAHARTSDRE